MEVFQRVGEGGMHESQESTKQNILFIVAPNEVGNYRMIGSVCLYVCMCVCLHLFSSMVRLRKMVFSTIVGYRSETKPIDFGVNGYIFKVKVMKI